MDSFRKHPDTSASEAPVPTILVISSSPIGHAATLDDDEELAAIFKGVLHRRVRVERLNPPTLDRFRTRLCEDDIRIVHITCECVNGHVVLEEGDGSEKLAPGSEFAETLDGKGIALVVLSRSADGEVKQALLQICPRVVTLAPAPGGLKPSPDSCERLYAALAEGKTLDRAVALRLGSGVVDFRAEGDKTGEKVTVLSEPKGKATLSRSEPENNLPSRTLDPFFGRASELKKAYTALHDGSTSPFLGVTGLPASGKSAFARAVARRYGHLFPDGIAYLKLSSGIKGQLILPTALAHLMPDLASQPDARVEQEAIDRLGKGPFLVILDDAECLSDADAEHLQGCLSRWNTVTGGRAILIMRERRSQFVPLIKNSWIKIGDLSEEACRQLFTRELGGHDKVNQIVGDDLGLVPKICHNHAGLLTIASGALSSGMLWGDLKHSLSGILGGDQLSALLKVLDESLRRAEHKVPGVKPLLDSWLIFGDFAQDDAWRFVSGGDQGKEDWQERGEALAELARCNAISQSSIEKRVYWDRPPIITECLRARWNGLSDTTRAGFESRAIDYFTNYLPALSDVFFAHDWEPLRKLLESGLSRGEHRRVLNFCDAALDESRGHILSTGPWDAARLMANYGVEAAEGLSQVDDRVRHLVNLGECNYRAAQYFDASEAYQKALSLVSEIPGLREKAVDLLRRKGQVEYRLGRLNEAETIYKEALSRAKLTGKPELVAGIEHQLGKVLYRQNRLDEAQGLFEKVRDNRAARNDLRGLAKTLHELGRVHHAQHQFNAALNSYEESLQLRRKVGDQVGEQATQYQLAVLALDLDEPERARQLLEECRKLARDLRDPFWHAHSIFLEAQILHYDKKIDEALEKAREAETASRRYHMGMAEGVRAWIRDVQIPGKRRKALAYASDRSRFTIEEDRCIIRSEHGTRTLVRKSDGWTCNCPFFADYHTCSHVMAFKIILEASNAEPSGGNQC